MLFCGNVVVSCVCVRARERVRERVRVCVRVSARATGACAPRKQKLLFPQVDDLSAFSGLIGNPTIRQSFRLQFRRQHVRPHRHPDTYIIHLHHFAHKRQCVFVLVHTFSRNSADSHTTKRTAAHGCPCGAVPATGALWARVAEVARASGASLRCTSPWRYTISAILRAL